MLCAQEAFKYITSVQSTYNTVVQQFYRTIVQKNFNIITTLSNPFLPLLPSIPSILLYNFIYFYFKSKYAMIYPPIVIIVRDLFI